jgi:hypothetical protein
MKASAGDDVFRLKTHQKAGAFMALAATIKIPL